MDATLIAVACISATPPTLMAALAWANTRKVRRETEKVHELVNSKMTAALAEIADLKRQLRVERGEE